MKKWDAALQFKFKEAELKLTEIQRLTEMCNFNYKKSDKR